MSGLFSTFNIARSGMSAQQKALDITSHNIANANTEGYSRQRATMETTRPFSDVAGAGQIGTGVQVSSITRIRDSYLDYRVRTENGTKGFYEGREKLLSEVEGVFNELSGDGVSSLLNEVFKSWDTLSGSANSNTRTVVAQQSKSLTDELNSTYNQLIKLKENSQEVVKQDVMDINLMLNQINELNKQVISVKVGGNEPNDLMDKRDLIVDQLSSKFGITIDKKALYGEDIKPDDAVGMENAYLVSSSSSDDVKRFAYVNSIVPSATQISGKDMTYDVTYYKNGDMSTNENKITMTMQLSADEYKGLDQGRVLWADKEGYVIDKDGNRIAGKDANGADVPKGVTGAITNATVIDGGVTKVNVQLFKPETGELKGYMSIQEDIDGYLDQLNSVAKGIALSINAVHSGSDDVKDDGLLFFVNSKDTTKNGEMGINAGNISVNEDILKDVMLIKIGKGDSLGSTDGNRALAISQLRYMKLEIQGIDESTTRIDFLKGKFGADDTLGVDTIKSSTNGMTIGGYFTNIVSEIAVQTQTAKKTVKNHTALLASLEESRTSVSGVSLDEEMANMIQYQHAYQANAKIISTVDELLDLIINGLKK